MANEQRTKFNFIKSLLNLKIEDIVNTPNKTVKVGSQSKTISEWCIETRLTLSNDVENIRKQLSNINLPNELLKCLPQFNELSRRVKQDTSINNTSLFQEKIFDAFVSGNVPVYWGAPDICDYIPKECFIDRREFQNHEKLYKFLKDMPEDQYLNYQESIKDFLENKSEEFSCNKFSSTISSKIIDVINNQI